MNNDEYIRRAQQAIEAAKLKAKRYNGDCSACRYSRMGVTRRYCTHAAVELVAFNLTDGYKKRRIVECDEQRDERSMCGPVVCGPNGALFEKSPSLFERLFGQSERTGA